MLAMCATGWICSIWTTAARSHSMSCAASSWPVAELPGSTLVDDSNSYASFPRAVFMRKRREALQRAAPLVLAPAPVHQRSRNPPLRYDRWPAQGAEPPPELAISRGTWVPAREFLATNGGPQVAQGARAPCSPPCHLPPTPGTRHLHAPFADATSPPLHPRHGSSTSLGRSHQTFKA